MQVQLSVVIITLNEEKNIGRCLSSVLSIADDIVVVDSFSTDKTKQICIDKKVRFITHKFEGHIEQKTWALTQAKYNHVLSLDADESLTKELQEELLKIKNNWQHDGYSFNRLTNFCGKWIKHCGWYPDKKLRMWDTSKGAWGGDNPHDKFILEKGATTHHINKDLLHYSFYTVDQHLKLDGYYGYVVCKNSAYAKKLKYTKLQALNNHNS